MKPYSIKRFLELLKQDRIRRNWNGIYFDIADYPFYDENRATPEVLNNLYNIIERGWAYGEIYTICRLKW